MNRGTHALGERGQQPRSDCREAPIRRASPEVSSAYFSHYKLAEQAVDIDV